ncbi:MAG: N-acetylornithine carbamoyltransferase [Bacteroidetes bacterium]|nr:MAG: N-acetylornithine carbamoyltransferase [Bacteroidota bacterium]
MRHFTSLYDVPDLGRLLRTAADVKRNPLARPDLGRGKVLGLIFFHSSLRTRLSTQRAAMNLGLEVIVMNVGSDAWKLEFADGTVMDGDTAEHVRDAVAVMGQYCDILGVRTFAGLQDKEADYAEPVLQAFIDHAGVPILSLESATRHPLQSLADWVTIETYKQVERPKVVLTWAPHPRALPQAVANSFVEWMRQAEVDLVITHPEGYELSPRFVHDTPVEYDPVKAYEGADFIYAKNWSAYYDYGQILSQDRRWLVDAEKMARTSEAHFMHCLPVRRNVVVADAVIDSPQSLVIPQAGHRVVSAQAVLQEMLVHLGG